MGVISAFITRLRGKTEEYDIPLLKRSIETNIARIQLALKSQRYATINSCADSISLTIRAYHTRVQANLRRPIKNERILDDIETSISYIKDALSKHKMDTVRTEIATLQSLHKCW